MSGSVSRKGGQGRVCHEENKEGMRCDGVPTSSASFVPCECLWKDTMYFHFTILGAGPPTVYPGLLEGQLGICIFQK